MNRRHLFTLMFIVGDLLLSSCNGAKNKVNDEKARDSIGVNISDKTSQVVENHKVIPFESINVDSVIGNYRVLYKTQDNGQIVTTYPITDGKGKDTVCYATSDIILTIYKNGKNIILNRKIQRDDFKSFIPEKEILNCRMTDFSLKEINNNEIFFNMSFCIPDTDFYYQFELIVSDNDKIKISEVREFDSCI